MSKMGADDSGRRPAGSSRICRAWRWSRGPSWPRKRSRVSRGSPRGRRLYTLRPTTLVPTHGTSSLSLGNLIGAGPHARVAYDAHPARLDAVLVGQSAKARKGSAWSTPRYCFAALDRPWAAGASARAYRAAKA